VAEVAGLDLRIVSLDDAVARGLEAAHIDEMHARYGVGKPPALAAADFEPPAGCFLVGFADEEPVACGGWRQQGDGIAEIKRMYVVPSARRRGFSRIVLATLEQGAQRAGYRQAWLETGTEQPEALGLYESAGYLPIAAYGEFRHDRRSRCFAKDLDAELTPSSRAPGASNLNGEELPLPRNALEDMAAAVDEPDP
jgi:GNAT superfamily N-acetyltransferase